MGRSKLAIPAAKGATARNMNTIAKLAQMADEVSPAPAKSRPKRGKA